MNCFRFLNFRSFDEVDRITIPEYELLMEAANLKRVDMDYRSHLQAWLNRAVKAEKGKGKNVRPVFTKFKQFYDYDSEVEKASAKRTIKSRFSGVGKFLKKGE